MPSERCGSPPPRLVPDRAPRGSLPACGAGATTDSMTKAPIVGDDAIVQGTLALNLRAEGCEGATAGDGRVKPVRVRGRESAVQGVGAKGRWLPHAEGALRTTPAWLRPPVVVLAYSTHPHAGFLHNLPVAGRSKKPDLGGLDGLPHPAAEKLGAHGRGTEVDRIIGPETDPDNCIVEPFSLGEVQARMRAALRRDMTTTTAAGRLG